MTKPTEAQRLAVEARGNVLVVAGAGAGKTSTLVARCVDRIVRERASVERMLMVTFTEAAATEMRQRIGEALEKVLEEWKDGSETSSLAPKAHVEEQLALLDNASISTLSSFCLELVREHFHELHLDPQLTVFDDDRLAPLIEETLDALFESAYAASEPDAQAADVRALVRTYGSGSDFAIRALVLKIHRYTQTLPAPDQWFADHEALFDMEEPQTWRCWLGQSILEWRALWQPVLAESSNQAQALARCDAALRGLPENPALDVLFAALQAIRAADGDVRLWERKKGTLRPSFSGFFKDVDFLSELQPQKDLDPLAEDWDDVRAPMLALVRLVREFGKNFSAAKRELGGVDFADIEQFALGLLKPNDKLTPVAQAVRVRYDHVFVDEYQDINAVQDAIINAVSRSGNAERGVRSAESEAQGNGPHSGNRFLVGDVKQSIYRFRLAQPRIFTGYDERWSQSEEGRRIPLSENFRSREAILNFVNPLFAALMRRSIGGLEYADDARLVFGDRAGRESFTAAHDGDRRRVEIHLLAKSGDADKASNDHEARELMDLEAVEREARLIARRLLELHQSGLLVRDKDGVDRPVEYRQMVILMRSPRDRIEAFAKQFHRLGVPLRAARPGFYEAAEVSDLLSLLQLLDNPRQDLPLLAVLHSPLVGLSPEELAEIRGSFRDGGWWPAMRLFRSKGPRRPGAWAKIDGFLKQFEDWRELMLHSSVAEVLETVLAETHYESILASGERGPERLANARRFIDLARTYDPLQRQGLYRFLGFVEAQRAADLDREPAPAPADNAVQLMSVHRSKGLEFPVVVLAGMGGTFNERNLHDSILLSEELGLCPKVFPAGRNVIYPSLPHWLAQRAERRELFGEEMRLLYVALTRAKEMLILAGTASGRNEAAKWAAESGRTITDAEILRGCSYLDWLRLWLPQVTTDDDWINEREGENALLRWKLYGAEDEYLRTTPRTREEPPQVEPFDAVAALERLGGPYPFMAATRQSAKGSVSVLRRGEEDEDAQPIYFRRDWSDNLRPSGKLSRREAGTAHHRFQQFVALNRVATFDQLQSEAARLVSEKILEPVQAAALRYDQLLNFWQSPTGRLIQKEATHVRRELAFTARFTTKELTALGFHPMATDEPMVIQGMVDLAIFLEKEIWLLDFKTDDIRAGELGARTAEHAPQVALYARALEAIHGRAVTRRWLHFFALGRTVDVPAPGLLAPLES